MRRRDWRLETVWGLGLKRACIEGGRIWREGGGSATYPLQRASERGRRAGALGGPFGRCAACKRWLVPDRVEDVALPGGPPVRGGRLWPALALARLSHNPTSRAVWIGHGLPVRKPGRMMVGRSERSGERRVPRALRRKLVFANRSRTENATETGPLVEPAIVVCSLASYLDVCSVRLTRQFPGMRRGTVGKGVHGV
jgi:hypothetical protein